jgi:molecular chaperone GrpE
MATEQKPADEKEEAIVEEAAENDAPLISEKTSEDLVVEYLDGWKRCQAEFENYKKRQTESQKELGGFLIEKLLFDIIPVLDNFRMATSHVPEAEKDSPWVTGIGYIEKQLEDALAGHGVSVMEVKEGDVFDPSLHEAVSHESRDTSHEEESEPQEENAEIQDKGISDEKGEVIAKVLQNGYRIGDRVVRAAKVTVKNA